MLQKFCAAIKNLLAVFLFSAAFLVFEYHFSFQSY